tara:strand:- start:1314 stop:2087 length:774 start_codon:yes stop_codon:yes gene_type:complete
LKVVILAGGFGTRLLEHTTVVPKPMVEIGHQPILMHICDTFLKYKYNDFVIAAGYKQEYIKNYFLNYSELNSDFEIDYNKNKKKILSRKTINFKVKIINTGLNTMTGGRLLRLKKYFKKNENFILTYGDSLANINIKELIKYHDSHKKLVTITAVRPPARFGLMDIGSNSQVKQFKEKVQFKHGWINGGYMVINSNFFDYIDNDDTYLEREPLERVSKEGQLMAYKHEKFWHCMDTQRDKENLEKLCQENLTNPWLD